MKKNELKNLVTEWRNLINEDKRQAARGGGGTQLSAAAQGSETGTQELGSYIFTFSDKLDLKNAGQSDKIDLTNNTDIQNLNNQFFLNLLEKAQSTSGIDPRNLGTDSELMLQNFLASSNTKVSNINSLFTRDNAQFADLYAESEGKKTYWSCKMTDELSGCKITLRKIFKAFSTYSGKQEFNVNDEESHIGVCWLQPESKIPGTLKIHLYSVPARDVLKKLYASYVGRKAINREFSLTSDSKNYIKDLLGTEPGDFLSSKRLKAFTMLLFHSQRNVGDSLFESRLNDELVTNVINNSSNLTDVEKKELAHDCYALVYAYLKDCGKGTNKADVLRLVKKLDKNDRFSNFIKTCLDYSNIPASLKNNNRNAKFYGIFGKPITIKTKEQEAHAEVGTVSINNRDTLITLDTNFSNSNIDKIIGESDNALLKGEKKVITVKYLHGDELKTAFADAFSYDEGISTAINQMRKEDFLNRPFGYLTGGEQINEKFAKEFPYLSTFSGAQTERSKSMPSAIGHAAANIKRNANDDNKGNAKSAIKSFYDSWAEIQSLYLDAFNDISELKSEEVNALIQLLNKQGTKQKLQDMISAVDKGIDDNDNNNTIGIKRAANGEFIVRDNSKTKRSRRQRTDQDAKTESIAEAKRTKKLKDLYKL